MEAERASRRNRIAVAATLAAAALLLGLQLLRPPIVGLADNGDFERLMHPAGLDYVSAHPEDRYYGWMQPRFAYAPRSADSSGYRSSEMLLVETAVGAGRMLSKSSFFDTRFLGALHAVLLLLALGALVAACRDLGTAAQVTAAALLVFFFTDVGYIGPFNSLYSQTASLLFLLATTGAAALAVRRGSLSGLLLAVFFLAAALFVCAKPQEVVHAPILALLGVRLAWPNAPRRRRAAALALAVLLCALAARYYLSAERSIGWVTRYNIIFMVLLPESPRPAADLAEMGLDPSLAKYSGVSAWVAGSPAADPEMRARINASSPRAFLLRHPERLHALLRQAVRSAWILRPPELGNFAKESGRPARAQSFGPWSSARAALGGAALLVLLLGGTLGAAIATYRRASARGRLARQSMVALVLMTVAAFAAAVAGDTHMELVRHLYTFQALSDLVLVAAVAWVVRAVAVRRAEAHLSAASAAEARRLPRLDPPVVAAIAVAVAILAAQLLVPPIIGLANNGDFEKVMGYAGIRYRETAYEDKFNAYIVQTFDRVQPGWYRSGYLTSETLLALLARGASGPLSQPGAFDIRFLGALLTILLLIALGIFVAACRDLRPAARWAVAALLVLVFTDVGYAAPFNSFYSQAASLVFVLLTLAIAALATRNGRLKGGLLVAYFVCAALFVCSKPQEPVHGPLLAALGWILAAEPARAWWRRPASWLAVGLCVLSLAYYRAIPREAIRNVGLFHTVFTDLLPNSPDPAADLVELGLNADLLRYNGTNAYQPGAPMSDPDFDARFFQRFDFASLVRFYVRHPIRLADRLKRGAPLAFRLRPWRAGNYTKDSGYPRNTMTSHFALWSDTRLRLGRHGVAALLLLYGVNATLVFFGGRFRFAPMPRLARVTLGIVLAMAVVEYVVCALADYLGDFSRHLYVFQALYDLVLIADIGWAIQSLAARSRSLPGPAPARA